MFRSDKNKEKKITEPVIHAKKGAEKLEEENNEFFQAVVWLKFSNACNKKNKKLLIDYPKHALTFSLCIAQLASKHFLNESNYALLVNHIEYSEILILALHELDKKNLFTQDAFYLLCSHAEDADTMAVDIILLNNKKNWSTDIIDLLKKNSQHANYLLRRLAILSEANYLNKIKLEIVTQYPEQTDDAIAIAMIELGYVKLLTNENMIKIFENPKSIRAALFDIIAEKPSTQDDLNDLMKKHRLPHEKESKKTFDPPFSVTTNGMFAPCIQLQSVENSVAPVKTKNQSLKK